jgi:hypothetical protein
VVVAGGDSRFVGRSAELGRLEAAYAAAVTGEARIVVVGDESGFRSTHSSSRRGSCHPDTP